MCDARVHPAATVRAPDRACWGRNGRTTMLQVGIFNGYFPYPLVEQARRIRGLGFNAVQLDFNIKGMDFSTPQAVTPDKARHIRGVFRDHDLPPCCLPAPTNLLH